MTKIKLDNYYSICQIANQRNPEALRQWLTQTNQYEDWWNQYITNIYIPHRNREVIPMAILWESCPGGTPFPHPNYAFANLSCALRYPSDMYLINAAKSIGLKWKNEIGQPKTKELLLLEMAQLGYFIMDLLPTHGFHMSSLRKKLLLLQSDHSVVLALRKYYRERESWLQSILGASFGFYKHEALPICGFLGPMYRKIVKKE
jgi:hypothetical protein